MSAQPAAANVQEVVVTGSNIRRRSIETASPVQVITATELKQSGFDNITDVLTNITANGAGTLSANNSEAFAGGAAGIALRGLSVGDTLTLVDGHRLAPYPLSDDSERQFTDIQDIPFELIDHVEVLKDGASSVYGSDAIAGVVNIILKKSITGFQGLAEGGDSQHGGGATQHYSFTMGHGDLGSDGYNAYIGLEYRKQDPIYLRQRQDQDFSNTNFTSLGGVDLLPGASNVFNGGLPATLTPYLVSTTGNLNNPASYSFLNSGCNYAKLSASQCTYTSPATIESPTQNIDVLASFTKNFGSNWQANVKLSLFDSKGQQNGTNYSSFPGPSFAGYLSNPVGGLPTPNIGAIGDYSLPATYPGNTTGTSAFLEGVIPQIGVPLINFDTETYRAAFDMSGKLYGWDVSVAAGASEVETHSTYNNFVNFDNLYTALQSGAFNPLGGNGGGVLSSVDPEFSTKSQDDLAYFELNANRKVFTAANFDLSAAGGFEEIYRNLKQPGAVPVLNGVVGGTFSDYVFGDQSDTAAFGELDATVFKQVEINASARYDYFNTYGSSVTPKVGVKWRPSPIVAFRGTYSEGFRAPDPAEVGNASTLFGLGIIYPDPILCGNDAGQAKGQVPASCNEEPGFAQKTNPLKPETSKSETAGIIFEPIKGFISNIEFYNIEIKNQIITAAEFPGFNFATACQRGADLSQPGVSNGDGTTGVGVPLVGPIAICDSGYVNADSTKTNGLDFDTGYRFRLPFESTLTTSFSYTYILNYDLTGPTGTVYHLAGTHGPSGVSGDTGNPRVRTNVSAAFDKGPFDIAIAAYRIGSYSVTDPSSGISDCQTALLNTAGGGQDFYGATSAPSQFCKVKAFNNVNLTSTYRVGSHFTFYGSIQNLFDKPAPLDFQTYGGSFLPYNPSLHEAGVIQRYFTLGIRFQY